MAVKSASIGATYSLHTVPYLRFKESEGEPIWGGKNVGTHTHQLKRR